MELTQYIFDISKKTAIKIGLTLMIAALEATHKICAWLSRIGEK